MSDRSTDFRSNDADSRNDVHFGVLLIDIAPHVGGQIPKKTPILGA